MPPQFPEIAEDCPAFYFFRDLVFVNLFQLLEHFHRIEPELTHVEFFNSC